MLVPAPLDRTLDYLAPPEGCGPGDWVEVALGPRPMMGICWGPGSGDYPVARLRPAIRRLDLPPLGASTRAFLEKAADYTLTEFGMMARLASRAPGLRAPPGTRKVLRRGTGEPPKMTPARRPTSRRAWMRRSHSSAPSRSSRRRCASRSHAADMGAQAAPAQRWDSGSTDA